MQPPGLCVKRASQEKKKKKKTHGGLSVPLCDEKKFKYKKCFGQLKIQVTPKADGLSVCSTYAEDTAHSPVWAPQSDVNRTSCLFTPDGY